MNTPLIRFFGSIQFAVPLLASIVAILIGATIYESQVGSTVVQHLIYKSPWFGMLMFLLAVNLLISALTRYPWRGSRKAGFALTHIGLVLIIVGSAGVIHLSLEGMLPLREDLAGNNQIRVEGDLLEVMTAEGEAEQRDIFIRPDGSISPSSVLGLSLLGYAENTVETVRFKDGGGTNNVALKVRLTSARMGQEVEQWLGFAPLPYRRVSLGPAELRLMVVESEETVREKVTALADTSEGNYFQAIATSSGKLYYATHSSQGFQSGILKLNEPIALGWADFEITLEEQLTHAEIDRQIVPVGDRSVQGTPAILVKTETGIQTWLPWGEPTAIPAPDGDILAAFTPKLFSLPFQVALQDFIVERNEGSESVAMWTSKIQIQDPHQHISSDRTVWMNHPTWYQGWKIAQASWNPGDLRQSTLQVKREPLWITLLTWTGSALVVVGIGTMFYGKAIHKSLTHYPSPISFNLLNPWMN
ncbi:MAG: cytochrome c biogenesis protein ResB [Roseofilum sp. SBFL]|uniref:cytochrome c biogenesis protein ResB n=1 Tax=unclassified Roseofilum TaxID=2620099 RepID=UPI001B27BCA7|nr:MULTISPECIES: cytochrome c biogenesis protein ResB [unclassified Roseofilum]MBP0013280.1 cytochrome c biogenesis protein ResB [Roseofilum sp. SID3]MBP0026374.1 cytochrome c biogenesis protein ResB [Roseofilum sp. SID2]MBP0038205.1 cytochrome c biogenesis protein ResB [Roseofilum sp. SID1]MBP0040874.1 cytochrome c biogenesis protein ResB [Roseofilum sp. SBFL]